MKVNDPLPHKARSALYSRCFSFTGVGGSLNAKGATEHYALYQRQTADTVVPWQDTSTVRPDSCAPSEEHRHPIDAAVAGVKPSHARLIDGH